jgi:hypothetical protein
MTVKTRLALTQATAILLSPCDVRILLWSKGDFVPSFGEKSPLRLLTGFLSVIRANSQRENLGPTWVHSLPNTG